MGTHSSSDALNKQKKQHSIRVFENDLLESLTHVHPITPLLVWGPVTLLLFINGLGKLDYNYFKVFIWTLSGILVWTFIEYIFHRYVFHFPAKSALGKRLVFLFHGLHHDDPHDKTRLVFPPVPAAGLLSLFYFAFAAIIPESPLFTFLSGFLFGYLCYDYIHYATHHFPMKSKVGKYLRKYHLVHHFSDSDAKFGVSSPLWDYVFNTVQSKKSR